MFATVMSLVLYMCILISCSSVLMALGMLMFVLSVFAYGGVVGYFWCFSFLCEFCFLYCDDARWGAV